ncbi:hypothetical protein T06_13983 [Trichinella sp. T6]|nr:hypothetical protein T06_13983 [Trichinella sp. T6]
MTAARERIVQTVPYSCISALCLVLFPPPSALVFISFS